MASAGGTAGLAYMVSLECLGAGRLCLALEVTLRDSAQHPTESWGRWEAAFSKGLLSWASPLSHSHQIARSVATRGRKLSLRKGPS